PRCSPCSSVEAPERGAGRLDRDGGTSAAGAPGRSASTKRPRGSFHARITLPIRILLGTPSALRERRPARLVDRRLCLRVRRPLARPKDSVAKEHAMSNRIEPAQPPFSPEVQAWLDRIMPPGVPPLALFTTLARDERLFQR